MSLLSFDASSEDIEAEERDIELEDQTSRTISEPDSERLYQQNSQTVDCGVGDGRGWVSVRLIGAKIADFPAKDQSLLSKYVHPSGTDRY